MINKVHTDRWEAVEEAAELIRDGEVDLGIEMLSSTLKEDENNEYAHFFLGCAYFEKENYPRAMRSYLKALEVEPKYTAALVHLGQTLRMMGRTREAIAVGKQLLATAPHDSDVLYLLGMSHYAQGDDQLAQRYLHKFLDTNPELEIAMEVQGVLHAIEPSLPQLSEDDDDSDDKQTLH